jgi:hypothetical protein
MRRLAGVGSQYRFGVSTMRAWRVVKVGGSLLDAPGIGQALHQWLTDQAPRENLLLVGGGALADQVRQLDQRYGLPSATAHWLAIRAMDLNGFVLSQVLPQAKWIPCYTERAPAQDTPGPPHRCFVSVEQFLCDHEPRLPGLPLPVGWHVTSDSIAARLAEVCGAEELVLLKSRLPAPAGADVSIADAMAAGYVDTYFEQAAARLRRVRAVNLRDRGFAEVWLMS